ncbi:MAG: penicillin acylase family protein [Candidatus Melainabacteria bacterium]|nr:MAG: penicillin acylase family protein [Candidatus Melainabacteria bacterium]
MLRILALVLLLTLLGVPTFGWWLAQRSLPVMDGIVAAPQLVRSAMVKYDDRGIPYIEASSAHDIFFTQGYITASQRMFQMDILRRTALGELSGLLGPSSLAEDKLNRTIGFNRIAKEEWKKTSRKTRADIQAYCDGVNAYLSANQGKISPEFLLLGSEPSKWNPTDSIAILKYNQYTLEESWRLDDLKQRVLDKIGDQQAGTLFSQTFQKDLIGQNLNPAENIRGTISELSNFPRAPQSAWGSNSWAVAAPFSDSKGALLACDKHSGFTSPDEWFICSLASGEMHLAGATIPGVPGILIGRNADIGWSSVALKADTQDLFLEQFAPQFPGKYHSPTGWENVVELTEAIPVRFGKPLLHKVLVTKHGPILSKTETTGVALAWSGADSGTTPVFDSIWAINQAKSWQDFNAALSHYAGSAQTFLFVDRLGNIGYQCAGNIPVRVVNNGNQLMPGWQANSEWRGRAAFASLPSGFKPAANYVVADSPALFNGYNFNNPFRAMRVESALESLKKSNQKVGLPDMAYLQCDQLAHLSALVKKEVKQASTRTESIDKLQLSAITALDQWDGQMTPNSVAASIYESFIITFAKRILEPKLGTEMTLEYMRRYPRWSVFVEQVLSQKPKEWLPPEERTYETFVLTTFGAAIKNLTVASKSEDQKQWQWQKFHKINFDSHLADVSPWLHSAIGTFLEIAAVGVGGDADTVNACNVDFQAEPWLFKCDSGPTVRLLIDMADPDQFFESIPLGQSGHILSSNRADQLKPWLEGKPLPVAFSNAQLDKQQEHKLILNNE